MALLVLPFVLWFVAFIYSAFSLTLLWSWFMVPFGLPGITFPWAIGLCCIIGLIKGVPASDKDGSILSLAIKDFALVSLALVIGFIAHTFM